MQLAFVQALGPGETNQLLAELALRATARGLRVVGVVQTNTPTTRTGHCDMDVTVLPAGPVLRISQDLGPLSKGCRLDPDALETAVALSEAALLAGADVLIVNKFGKHEAEGRGFRGLIAEALARDIAVIVGLNGLNRAAFERFGGGLAREITPEAAALEHWLAGCAQGVPC